MICYHCYNDVLSIYLSFSPDFSLTYMISCIYQLISRSPVFYAMLCGELHEEGEIVIEDIEPRAFRQQSK